MKVKKVNVGNKDSKLRLCLIAVIVTSIVIFISINALSLLEESMKQDLRKTQSGCSDYIVKSMNEDLFEFDGIENADALPVISLRGKLTSGSSYIGCNVWGVDYSGFLKVFGDTYNESGEVEYPASIDEKQVIISSKLCDKLRLNSNDKVELSFKGVSFELNVVCAPKDNYFAKSNDEDIIVSKAIFTDLLENSDKKASVLYLYNVNDKSNFKDKFAEKYPDLLLSDAIDPVYISQNMMTYYGVEFFIFIFILMVAFDIIGSSGNIYIIEKSKDIGTLRSVGYTKTNIMSKYRAMAFRLAMKGVVSAIIIGTIGILAAAKFAIGLKNPLDGMNIIFYAIALVFTFIVMVFMCITSFSKPLKKLFDKSDRSLLLEDASSDLKVNTMKNYNWAFVVLAICLCIVFSIGIKMNIYVSMVLSTVYFVALFRSIKFIFMLISDKIRKTVKRGTFTIALKNVSGNYYLRKTLNLTMIVSLFIIIIGSLIFSVLSAMTSFYKDYNVDAFARTENNVEISEEELENIRSLDEVTYLYSYYRGKATVKVNSNSRKVTVLALDDLTEFDKECMSLHLKWLSGVEPASFSTGNNVVVSEILMVRYDLKLGDEIEFDDGTYQKRYKIVASTSSLQELGDLVYVSRNDKEMFDGSVINGIYLKSNNVKVLEDKISGILYDKDLIFKDVTSIRENDMINGMQVIIFFIMFAMLVALTSVTGIYSNYKLSYIMRRKEMAILGSVGYSNKMILSILSKEVSIISLLSFVVGIGILLLLKKPLEIFLRFVDIPIQIQINLYLYIGLFIVIVFMMIMNIILAKRSCRNINNALIEEIKR